MAQATIATEVHQTLDRHTDLAAKIALDRVLGDFGADLLDLTFAKRLDGGGRNHARVDANLLRPRTADSINALQADPDMLLDWQIDTRDARHDVLSPMRFVRGKRAILT